MRLFIRALFGKKYRALYGDAMFVPFDRKGAETSETSVIDFCIETKIIRAPTHCNKYLACSTVRIVYLAKP